MKFLLGFRATRDDAKSRSVCVASEGREAAKRLRGGYSERSEENFENLIKLLNWDNLRFYKFPTKLVLDAATDFLQKLL